ncbi:hypothetical protein Vafri_24 [Volvox africanus]|nr:hypothetical protein Vafri_24 [Volvox africanus]
MDRITVVVDSSTKAFLVAERSSGPFATALAAQGRGVFKPKPGQVNVMLRQCTWPPAPWTPLSGPGAWEVMLAMRTTPSSMITPGLYDNVSGEEHSVCWRSRSSIQLSMTTTSSSSSTAPAGSPMGENDNWDNTRPVNAFPDV